VAAQKLAKSLMKGSTSGKTASREAAAHADAAPVDLVDRMILALVNECVACLRERVVEDADLIDAGSEFSVGIRSVSRGPSPCP